MIEVHGAPFDPKGDKLSFLAAFVCLDVREPYDYGFPHIVGVINATAAKLNMGGLLYYHRNCRTGWFNISYMNKIL